jgi:hypothetical protein
VRKELARNSPEPRQCLWVGQRFRHIEPAFMPAPFALPLQIHKRIHSKFLSVTSRSSHTDHPGDAPLGAVDQLSLWPFYDSLEIRVVNGVSPAFTPKNQIEMHRLLEQGRGFMAERRQVVPKLTKLRPARAITAVPKAQFQHGTTSAKTRSLSSSDQHSITEAAQQQQTIPQLA